MSTNHPDSTIFNGGFTNGGLVSNNGAVTGTINSIGAGSLTAASVTAAGFAGTGAGTVYNLGAGGLTSSTGITTQGSTIKSALNVSGTVSLTGDNADLMINGSSAFKGVEARLAAIETRLNILEINKELESDWEELAELGRQYREKEAEILEGLKIWDALTR